jgi:hypothetical protein
VCLPVLHPGISKNKLKSWLLCLQQLHSFIPSWKNGPCLNKNQ